jgi:hypothetical protein
LANGLESKLLNGSECGEQGGALEPQLGGRLAHFLLQLGNDAELVVGGFILGDEGGVELIGVLPAFFVGIQALLDGADDGLRGDGVLLVVGDLAGAAVFGDVDQGLDGVTFCLPL